MYKYNKDSIETLADVFCVWGGGYLESRQEIEAFLSSSHLNELISLNDYDRLLNHGAHLSEEALSAVYSLLPVKLKLKTQEEALSPQIFNKLNQRASVKNNSQVINIAFDSCYKISAQYLPLKKQSWEEHLNNVKKTAALNKRREAAKLRMRAYRAAHPESAAEIQRRAWENKSAEEKEAVLAAARIRNHKNYLKDPLKKSIYNITRRQKLKKENPELLKEMDRRGNPPEKHNESSRKYYEKNKELIAEKARNNPKTQEYKKRYKAKKRFQDTTHKTILPLLYGIINAKNKQ